jgi:regulation of enolase protein 1 (concanavalin A-like superfamily)
MNTRPSFALGLALGLHAAALCVAADDAFVDRFEGKLDPGWSWIREHREAWRIRDNALEVRVEPGNMWGGANNAKNVLIRPAPGGSGTIEASVQVENRPTEQYEQVNLVWFYDDSHMVKLGQELVDGQLSIVMGREEKDRTRTIAIIPLEAHSVRLRFSVTADEIRGEFKLPGGEWRTAGTCDLPDPPASKAKVSLQFYQGPANAEHWAKVTDFRLEIR